MASWLESEPDHHLVEWMALKDEDETAAMQACHELYRRHAGFLLDWSAPQGWAFFDLGVEDFVSGTFLKAYDNAATFSGDDKWSPKDSESKVRFWLMRILKNALIDHYRSQGAEREARSVADEFKPDGEIKTTQEIVETAPQPLTSAVDLPVREELLHAAHQLLQELSPLEKKIVSIIIEFFNPDTREVEIPSDVRKGICAELKISESSLRVYRKRVRDRLRLKVSDRGNSLSPVK